MEASAFTDNPRLTCPCGSKTSYATCCQPYHTGQCKAPTAEILMRTRYAAYAKKETDYLVRTTAPQQQFKGLAASIDESNRWVQWIQLEIHETISGSAKDKKGIVAFSATFSENGHFQILRERSRFLKIANQWFYLDGIISP